MKPDKANVMDISKQTWQQVIQEGRKSIMNQYIMYYKDGTSEPVDAYSYTKRGDTYTFDLGHGKFRYCYGVDYLEVL